MGVLRPQAEDVLRVEVTAAMVRSLGEMGVDRVLADGRKNLIATATRRAQAGLDAAHSGLELSSLELTRLAPPLALAKRFRRRAERLHRRGDEEERGAGVRGERHPAGPGRRATCRCRPPAARPTPISPAPAAMPTPFWRWIASIGPTRRWFASASTADAVERAIGIAGKVRWVPPPVGGSYHGFPHHARPNGRSDPGPPPRRRSGPDDDDLP